MVCLTLEDVDWEAGRLTVRGKGNRSTELPALILSSETHTLRTVMRISAPIFSSLSRMLEHWALASSVRLQSQPSQNLQQHVFNGAAYRNRTDT